jgi:hypothetical protein
MRRLCAAWAALLMVANTMAAAAPRPDAKFVELEQRYLACSRAAMTQLLSSGEAAQCSVIYERLLSERFGGDFERLLQWSRLAHRTDDGARTPFDTAQAHYEAGHYAEAYALFAQLADCGHREAARIALHMRRFGPALYGQPFEASPQRQARWQGTLAAETQAGPGSCTAA